jgi:hypothetical protein
MRPCPDENDTRDAVILTILLVVGVVVVPFVLLALTGWFS